MFNRVSKAKDGQKLNKHAEDLSTINGEILMTFMTFINDFYEI